MPPELPRRGVGRRASRPERRSPTRLGWSTVWTTDHVMVPERRRRRLRPDLRGDPDPRLGRRPAPGAAPCQQRHRGAAAQRGRAGQGARDARFPERRSADRRGGRRLERGRVRQPRRRPTGSAPRAPTSTRRSGCGVTSGPVRPSRSTAGSTRFDDFAFGPLPAQGARPADRSSAAGPSARCGAPARSATGITRARWARPSTASGSPIRARRGRDGRPAHALALRPGPRRHSTAEADGLYVARLHRGDRGRGAGVRGCRGQPSRPDLRDDRSRPGWWQPGRALRPRGRAGIA